jgi:hypothetical protein
MAANRLATGATSLGTSGRGLLVGCFALLLDTSVSGSPVPVLEVGTTEASKRSQLESFGTSQVSRTRTYTSIPFSKAYATALICSSLSFSRTAEALLFKLGILSMASMARLNRSALFLMASSSGVSMFPFSL